MPRPPGIRLEDVENPLHNQRTQNQRHYTPATTFDNYPLPEEPKVIPRTRTVRPPPPTRSQRASPKPEELPAYNLNKPIQASVKSGTKKLLPMRILKAHPKSVSPPSSAEMVEYEIVDAPPSFAEMVEIVDAPLRKHTKPPPPRGNKKTVRRRSPPRGPPPPRKFTPRTRKVKEPLTRTRSAKEPRRLPRTRSAVIYNQEDVDKRLQSMNSHTVLVEPPKRRIVL